MSRRAKGLAQRLDELRWDGSASAAERRVELLCELERAVLPSAGDVERLHEALLFLRAYPGLPAEREVVERMLAAFSERRDLRRWRAALGSSGIAGTALHAEFYWFTALWLAERWPRQLSIDWPAYERLERLEDVVHALLEEHELLAIEGETWTLRGLVDALRAPDETDATYVVRLLAKASARPLVREWMFDGLALPMVLASGPDTPQRTTAAFGFRGCVYRDGSKRAEPSIRARIEAEPRRVRRVSRADGARLVQLGHEALITRGRDLFAFMHGDPNDVVLVDFDGGLQIACIGLVPERRHLLYTQYVFLTLQNGVPLGYVQACVLFDSAEINFNVFDTFRGFDASRVFTSSLATARHLFCADAFDINPQQLGQDNPEAIETGAWWFYYKHGFRPDDAGIERLVERELRKKARDPQHRSSRATLERFSERHLFLFLGPRRAEVVCRFDLGAVGRAVARRVHEQLGESGARATRASRAAAAERLAVRDTRSWSAGERLTWQRWAPLVVALPGVDDWTPRERRELATLIRKKGARRELDFLERFRRHERLQPALLQLEREGRALTARPRRSRGA